MDQQPLNRLLLTSSLFLACLVDISPINKSLIFSVALVNNSNKTKVKLQHVSTKISVSGTFSERGYK